MKVSRWANNPIIEPKDVKPSRRDFEVIGTFNAGVTRLADEVILLVRVAEKPISEHPEIALAGLYDAGSGKIITKKFPKNDRKIDFSDPRLIITPAGIYLTSISHLRLAHSKDGVNFKIEDKPAIEPANDYEAFGIEDPRISIIDGLYYINYVAVCPFGITTRLVSTKDFKSFERHGAIFCPDNKDVVIFPERIGGKYYALHRPNSPLFGKNDIWISESPDLLCWGNHRYLIEPGRDRWDEIKIGAGAVPFRTEEGWVEVYHGVDRNNRYCLGAVLLDSKEPWKVIARTEEPIFEPEADYETEGFFGNVVFSCGLLCEDEKLKIYYGAADTTVCYAELALDDVVENLNFTNSI
ncbi:MAG: glycosidase [Planctomycetota bacterium]|nr:MAG: glycosidase [Planctomycetota bacterium]